jgi:hypothetical protein
MRRTLAIALALMVGLGTAAFAEKETPTDTGQPGEPREFCDTTGYDCIENIVEMLLETDLLYEFGPIAAPADYGDVILEINLDQTWVGDLVAFLNSGTVSVAALCRPSLAGCPFPDDCCGCSGDVSGTYQFSDAGTESLGDPNCPSTISPGCYLPAPESANSFADFAGVAGDEFLFQIGDGAAGDDTMLHSWTVCFETGVTAVEELSWGKVKATYME